MKAQLTAGIILLWLLANVPAQAGKEKPHDGDAEHVLLKPEDIKWGPAPAALPAGASFAVLSGDPTKAGPFTIRAKLPDGYTVPLHWHPSDEHVTVLQGTLLIAYEKGKDLAKQSLPAGSFMRMPKEMRHFAWAKGETIIQVHGVGPFDITYVNAADDPRKK